MIGLGGTGSNVIQALVESNRLERLLSSEDFQIACLGLDIADGDLSKLQTSYKNVQSRLREKGIPAERLWVKGLNIKFNTPDALFEFMEKYNTYLMKDGVVISNYKPWIDSSFSIPPLAGGVGRQRALSKAVYALNYYHFVELNSVLAVFKDRVLTSKYQPIVLVVFGLGGGTGSGMVFDFARHLRAKLSSAVPIVGLAILPSAADDLLARGPAPYATLMEGEAVFNRDLNDRTSKQFGEVYRDPFTALFFLPLDPVYNSKSSLMGAKKELDDAVVDILNIMMNFDLADLLSRVGTNNNFGPNWVHSLGFLRIRYPVEDYVNYLHEYLKLTERIGGFLNAKKEAISMVNANLKGRYLELVELYRAHLISINSYKPETFEDELNDVIHRAGKYDIELRKQMKGIEGVAAYYSSKWSIVFQGMKFDENSVEYNLISQAQAWMESISKLSKVYDDLVHSAPDALDELESNITASKFLTATQTRMVRAYANLVTLVTTAVDTMESYLKAKGLADEVTLRYAKDQSKTGKRAVTMSETELVPLFKAFGYLVTKPEVECKSFEQYLPGIRVVKKNMEARIKEEMADTTSQGRLLAQKEAERDRVAAEVKKVRLDLTGRRKMLQKNLDSLEADLTALRTQLQKQDMENEEMRSDLEKVNQLEKSLDLTSQYRKMLNSIVSKTSELNATMSEITTTTNYYERVVELSEAEQTKMMGKILSEQEMELRGEGILRDILDRDRFRTLVRSNMRIFSVSSYAGLVDKYRSDLIWVTVGIPAALWDQELQGSLSSTLSVFSSVEASKSISIRQIPQVDPWTITFLVVFAKARLDHVEKFSSMKSDAEEVRRSEKVMFRSYLLEHGFETVEEMISKLELGKESAGGQKQSEQRAATR